MNSDKEKTLEAGSDGYVSKPIDSHVLPKIIRQYLDRRIARMKTLMASQASLEIENPLH